MSFTHRFAHKEPWYEENTGDAYWQEWNYPNWGQLYNLTIDAIYKFKEGEKSKELIYLILQFMAINNETEDILDLCENELSNEELEYLIPHSIHFPLSETRWQIAELIGRTDNKNLEKYLLQLLKDKNKYVQRRALLSLAKINKEKAEQQAINKLNDEDNYIRLVSLRILHELSSKHLKEAVEKLNDDPFNYIQDEIEKIIPKF